jgi:hypothetical protein
MFIIAYVCMYQELLTKEIFNACIWNNNATLPGVLFIQTYLQLLHMHA